MLGDNKFKTSFTITALSLFVVKNNRLSSAKRRWLTIDADGATLIPLSTDDWFLSFKRHKRPSTANRNK